MTPDRPDATLDWPELMADRFGPAGMGLRAALALVPEAIQIWDAAGCLVLANPASESLFDHTATDTQKHDRLYGNCLQESGRPFPPDALPVARILQSGQPINDLMMMLRMVDDQTRWLKVNGRPIVDGRGRALGALVSASDITDFVEHKQHLEHLASYDALTQLPNRLLLAERTRISLARGRRLKEMVAVCMLDLDSFKPVNDNLGHKAGDELLREVAIRLQESVRGDDTVARVGGDEFAILLCGLHKVSECEQTLARLLARLGQPYSIAGQIVRIGASAGVTLFPDDGSDPDLLLNHADAALYQAKESGKNRFHFFDRKLDMRLQANRGLLRKIENAIRNRQFVLYYQPMVNCRTGQVDGVEALIRWHHPILGLLAPAEFLPLIEQDDLSLALGEWVIGEALRQLADWRGAGFDLSVSVNIAPRHLHQPDFGDRLAALLADQPAGLGQHLRIEIAESSAMADVNVSAEVLRQCHRLGIGVALDNFGIGYASLQHLKRLHIDAMKIDQSFIQGMLDTPEDLAIVGGVIAFAQPFGCRVIGEGAETIEHLLTLLELGCEVIQGYGLARPMPADQLTAWLRAFQPDPLWRLSATTRPSRDHFELLLVEANHRAWTHQAIELYRQHRDADALPGEFECPLGTWLNKPRTRQLNKHEEFGQIERLHHAIHQMAIRIGTDYRAGRPDQARIDEDSLLADHQRLLALMRTLRQRLNRAPLAPVTPPPTLETDR